MELHDDVIGLIVIKGPVTFLGVSKWSRAAALAAITSAIDVKKPGIAMYKGTFYYLHKEHICTVYDVRTPAPLCDINVDIYSRCVWCRGHREPQTRNKWLPSPVGGTVSVHYCEVIQIIIAAATGWRTLPCGFGAQI